MVVYWKEALKRTEAMKLSTSLILLNQRYMKITTGIDYTAEQIAESIFNYEMLRYHGSTLSFADFNNYLAYLDTYYLTGKELKNWRRIIGKDNLIVSYIDNLRNGLLNINLN